MLTRIQVDSSYAAFVLPILLISGFGIALVFPTAFNTALRGVAPEDSGVASAVLNTSQQIGASIGTSLLSTLAASATASYLAGHANEEGASAAAMVHGFGSATAWAAAIVVVVAIGLAAMLNARKPEPQAPGTEPVLVHAG
jgi:cytochrome bd-type quinol oxidase subunit 2